MGLDVWPNPAQGEVGVRALVNIESVKLLDALGRWVSVEQRLNGKEAVVQVDKLEPQVYFTRIQLAGGWAQTQRILVQ